jgi:hypothetical protein
VSPASLVIIIIIIIGTTSTIVTVVCKHGQPTADVAIALQCAAACHVLCAFLRQKFQGEPNMGVGEATATLEKQLALQVG